MFTKIEPVKYDALLSASTFITTVPHSSNKTPKVKPDNKPKVKAEEHFSKNDLFHKVFEDHLKSSER